jgi:hypothetical protein
MRAQTETTTHTLAHFVILSMCGCVVMCYDVREEPIGKCLNVRSATDFISKKHGEGAKGASFYFLHNLSIRK